MLFELILPVSLAFYNVASKQLKVNVAHSVSLGDTAAFTVRDELVLTSLTPPLWSQDLTVPSVTVLRPRILWNPPIPQLRGNEVAGGEGNHVDVSACAKP